MNNVAPLPLDLDITLHEEALSYIAYRCQRETASFQRGQPSDTRFCYELWRRALQLRDNEAWERLYVQYESLIIFYVKRHPSYTQLVEEPQHLVPDIFSKVWRAITPERFDRFPNLASLLKFLQVCTYHLVLDHCARTPATAPLEDTMPLVSLPLRPVNLSHFWGCVEQQAKDERERIVIRERLRHERKPDDILRRYAEHFPNKGTLYRTTENLRARLMRDVNNELKPCLEPFLDETVTF